MRKTEQMVDELLHAYPVIYGRSMEVSGLYLNAAVQLNPEDRSMRISVKISGYDSLENHVVDKKFSIWRRGHCVGSLKAISCPGWRRSCLGTEHSLVILENDKIQNAVFQDYQ